MSIESMLVDATKAGVHIISTSAGLTARGPAYAVNQWAPRLRQHRDDIEAHIERFLQRIEMAHHEGLLSERDTTMARQRCADPAAWRLWGCVIEGAKAATAGEDPRH